MKKLIHFWLNQNWIQNLNLSLPQSLLSQSATFTFFKTNPSGIIQYKTYRTSFILLSPPIKDPSKLQTTLSIGDSKLAI